MLLLGDDDIVDHVNKVVNRGVMVEVHRHLWGVSAHLNLCGGVELAQPHHAGTLVQTALVALPALSRLVGFGVGHALAGVFHGSCRGMVTLGFGVVETDVNRESIPLNSPVVDTSTIEDFKRYHLLLSGYNLILFLLRGQTCWFVNFDDRSK